MRGIVHGGLNSKGGDLPSFFGDSSDGAFNSVGNETVTVTEHTGIAVKQYTSFTLNAGHTFTVDNACQGLFIYVDGDVLVDGNLSMTAKGSYLTEPSIPALQALFVDLNRAIPVADLRGGAGGAGGTGGNGSLGLPGGVGGGGRLLAGGFGGGGGGGQTTSVSQKGPSAGGAIAVATMRGRSNTLGAYQYSDSETEYGNAAPFAQPGCGGGGAILNSSSVGASMTGGSGGAGEGAGGGGGGPGYQADGNPGGYGQSAGGFLCIIARGNITIGATGTIESKGGSGGSGGAAVKTASGLQMGGGGGGGGAGGGVVLLAHVGTYTNNGTVSVAGGAGGGGGNGYTAEDAIGNIGLPGVSGSAGKIIETTLDV